MLNTWSYLLVQEDLIMPYNGWSDQPVKATSPNHKLRSTLIAIYCIQVVCTHTARPASWPGCLLLRYFVPVNPLGVSTVAFQFGKHWWWFSRYKNAWIGRTATITGTRYSHRSLPRDGAPGSHVGEHGLCASTYKPVRRKGLEAGIKTMPWNQITASNLHPDDV